MWIHSTECGFWIMVTEFEFLNSNPALDEAILLVLDSRDFGRVHGSAVQLGPYQKSRLQDACKALHWIFACSHRLYLGVNPFAASFEEGRSGSLLLHLLCWSGKTCHRPEQLGKAFLAHPLPVSSEWRCARLARGNSTRKGRM